MKEFNPMIKPRLIPPLDEGFLPAALYNRWFDEKVKESGVGMPLLLGLERTDGHLSRFALQVFAEDHPQFSENYTYVERILKSLLWMRGGWKVYVGGSQKIGAYIQKCYSAAGERQFDYQFMGESIYEKTFTVVNCSIAEVPTEKERHFPLGRHLEGCRIGFDLGASDVKVSAVVNGEAIFSEEIVWEPGKQTDTQYHRDQITKALKMAAARMPRVDAIGGSSAGVIIDNRMMVASLFRGIPKEDFHQVHEIFQKMQKEWSVPLVVVNDGEVTALAGSMSLEENGILGIALGSSEAGGYVNLQGNITDWLNELAFVPVDLNPAAPLDEWSRDRGVGGLYFSQQCVFRLAGRAGISIPENITNADKLKVAQEKLESGHRGAHQIWESIGIYMGYGIAHYARFYDLNHILILGRVTSGSGGQIILDGANEVLRTEFPEISTRIKIQLPDEKSRRVGQSIAAASLPIL